MLLFLWLPGSSLKLFLLNQPLPLFDREDPVCTDIRNFVHVLAGPMDFDQINLRSLLESEMQPQIVLRKVTAAAVDFANLGEIAGNDFDSRTDAIAIAFHSDRLDQNRIAGIAAIVSQHLRRSVKIIDHDVDVAIVIDVPKRGAAARALLDERRPQLRADFGKGPIAVVVMHKVALRVGGQLWVDVTVDYQ